MKMERSLCKLDGREAIYTLKRGKTDFRELFKILGRTGGDVTNFHFVREGEIYSLERRIFSVRYLRENFMDRKKDCILMATTPSKREGFFIPWEPDIPKNTSNVVQILYRENLIFENTILIKQLGLEKPC